MLSELAAQAHVLRSHLFKARQGLRNVSRPLWPLMPTVPSGGDGGHEAGSNQLAFRNPPPPPNLNSPELSALDSLTQRPHAQTGAYGSAA